MTVEELIKELEKHNKDAIVVMRTGKTLAKPTEVRRARQPYHEVEGWGIVVARPKQYVEIL